MIGPADVAAMRDGLANMTAQIEAAKFRERGLVWYGEVHPAAVPQAKRRAAEDLLTKFARMFRSCPSLTWFSLLDAGERQLVEDGAYPFKAFKDSGDMLGFCTSDRRTVALLIDLESPQLERTLAHEFAHHLGVEDEDECDAFADNCLGA